MFFVIYLKFNTRIAIFNRNLSWDRWKRLRIFVAVSFDREWSFLASGS